VTPWAALAVAFAFLPAAIAVGVHLRMRREDRRLAEALEAEREETRRRYASEDDITERRQSFSAWPWRHR
jgi:hypothetical protein